MFIFLRLAFRSRPMTPQPQSIQRTSVGLIRLAVMAMLSMVLNVNNLGSSLMSPAAADSPANTAADRVARSGDLPADLSPDLSPDLLADAVEKVSFTLGNFALDPQGNVLGSRGNQLFRITGKTGNPLALHRFDARINSVHVLPAGQIVVATDDDHWDPETPCRIFISEDKGANFRLIKEIKGGSALWWSIASDSAGRIFVGEYGPRNNGHSKTVHRSIDLGKTWSAIFKAPRGNKSHVHRVAVDPYTDDVWVTTGDGKDARGVWRSSDAGDRFERIIDSQATGIAFTRSAIFLGEDRRKNPGVTRFDRQTEKLELVLDLKGDFDTAGSVYDIAVAASGALYAANMKYPNTAHRSSLWRLGHSGWQSVLDAPSRPSGGAGFETIGGPDRYGYIYVYGYRIFDPPPDSTSDSGSDPAKQ